MANGTLLDELIAQMKRNKQAPSVGSLSPSAPKTANYETMFKKALDETYRYAQVSPQTARDVANTITPGGAMTAYARGDVKSFNWDEAIQAERDRASATDYFRKSGLYDNDDYLYNDAYRFLVGTDYIKQQQPALKARLATSSFLDGMHHAAAQTAVSVGNARKVNQQAVRGFYNDMAARGVLENGNYTTDDLLYIDSLLNGTPRRSAEEFDSLPDEEWASEYERMEAQAEGVDWDSLLEAEDTPAFTPYESDTDAILSKIRTGEKELERREAFDALRADIRNDPNYGTMSAYTDTYVAPDRSIFGDQYAPYVNGYDNLGRFINAGAPWAELQVAGEHSMVVQGYLNAGYNMMTPEEIADYNYLINAGREDDAANYLELLRPELLLRRAMVAKSWQTVKATNPLLAVPTFLDAGIQNLASIASLPLQAYEAATGRDDPFSPANDALNKAQWTSEAHLGWIEDSDMADWLKGVTSVVYKGAAGWRDNVVRLAASGFNPTVSLLIAGAQSASGSLHESSERDDVSGAAKIVKALAVGALEMGTEKIGLDALFSKGHGGALEYLNGVILSELGEEGINYISRPALEAAVAFLFDHEAEIMSGPEFWNGLTDTMLTTAISSILMGGGGAVQMDAGYRRTGKGLRNDGDVESVLQIAEGLGTDTISAQIAKSIRAAEEGVKKVSTRELGKLVSALSSDIGEQNAAAVNAVYEDAIADRLIELGEEKSKARKQAKVIRRISAGEVLSVAERMSVNWSDNASQVVRELTTEVREGDEGRVGRDWKVRAVQLAEETSAPYVDKGVLFEKALHTKPGTTTETTAAPAAPSEAVAQQGEEMAAAGKNKFGPKPLARAVIFDADGVEHTGEVVRFEKDKDGVHAVVSTTTDGKTANVTVDLENITASASAGIGSIVRYVQNASTRGHDMSAAEASTMIRLYEQEGGDAKTFIDGFEKAYLAGYAGIELDSAGISEEVAKIAYDQGKAEAVADEKGRVARATRVRADSKGVVSWLGKVSSGKEVRGTGDPNALSAAMRKMTSSQRTTVQVVQAFADKFKTNVVLFESSEENIGSIENGSYDPNTNTIYIDINSGADSAESIKAGRKHNTLGHAMVRTLGHELTHHLESTSPEAYATYKQAVKTALKEQGQDWATLVRGKLDTARNAGRKLTYAGAEAEVIADASEYMLQNSKFVKEIDNSTKGRVKKFIKDFMKKLGEVFSTLARAHTESAAIRKEVDGVKQYMGNLQQLWDAAMEESMGMETSELQGPNGEQMEVGGEEKVQKSVRERDEAYMAAVERGDMETAQKMSDAAAKEAGYTIIGYHGTKGPTLRYDADGLGEETDYQNKRLPFTVFKPNPASGIYAASNRAVADGFKTGYFGMATGTTYKLYVKFYNPFVANEHVWTSVPYYDVIPTPTEMKKAGYASNTVATEEIAQYAKSAGYDGVIIEGIKEGFDTQTDDYIAFSPEQVKLADPVVYDDSGNVIPLSERFNAANEDIRYSIRDGLITTESTEQERYNILKGVALKLAHVNTDRLEDVDLDAYNTRKKSSVEKGIRALANKLGITNVDLENSYIDFPFQFTNKNLGKSLHHQLDYGGTYQDYVKAMSCFDELVENAVPIETHPDKKLGTVKGNTDLKQVYVLVSAFKDSNRVVPVQFEIKEYRGNNGKLYMMVALTKITPEVVEAPGVRNAKVPAPLFSGDTISLRYLFENVNSSDYKFFKYIPDGFLNDEQKAAKSRALAEQAEEYASYGNDVDDSSPDGIEVDDDTESAYPIQNSVRTWGESDYVTHRNEAAERLAKAIGVSVSKAEKWIDDVNSVSAYVLSNKARLDYIPTAVKGMSAFKSNPEYGGSIDMSTICAKRRLATGTLDAIQRVLGDAVLTKDDFLHIREMMKERGYEVACGLCFVESSRKNLSKYNRQFLDQYKVEHPDSDLGMVDLNTVEGLERIRSNPETADVYAAYEKFMNKLAQRKPKLFEKRTEYNHEILKKFKSDTTVGIKNRNGGLRLQSFSDFEIVHLIDMMQVITDMASVGLAGQAYTKVPDFAWALGDTGLKINLSLIAKDVDADGNLVFDDVEGMNHEEAKRLRDSYSKNVGTIVVTFTDEQTIAAMKSDFIDYIIPFHRSQWQKGDYKKLGLPEGTKDYTLHQNEKEGRKRVKENFLPNAYWDFSVSGKQNAINYLNMCAEAGRTPKFAKFLDKQSDGSYRLKEDGSTDGYWKLLIDFKMYDNAGVGSPQLAVQPDFNMDQAMRMLNEYKGEHDTFPVAQDVVDDFVKEYRGDVGGVKVFDGRYTVSPIQQSARDLPPEVTAREFLADADSSIAETVEERNALSIYQGLLLKHADASDKVIAAERVLAAADEADLPEARKALTAARARQKELYNRLLNVERTAHVQTIVKRTNRIIGDLSGKNKADLDNMVSTLQTRLESLRLDLQGLKGAAKTQREADIRAVEREMANLQSKAVDALLAANEKYTKRIEDLRERNELNVEIGKKARHIKRVVKRLNDRIIHEEDYKNVKEPLKPAVHNLVRAFIDGFGNLVFDQKTADHLRTVYDKIADEKEGSPDFYSDDVANWLTDLAALAEEDEARRIAGGSSLESVEQKLETYNRVAEIADHIYKMVAEADEIFVNGKRESFAAISGEVGGGLVSKKDKPLLVGKAREAVRIFDDLIRTGNMTPQYFFDHLKNSGLSKLFSGLMTGQTQYAQRIREGQEAIADAKRRYNFYAWKNMKQGVEFKTEQGHTISLTVPQMMWVYATAKREATNTLMDTHHLDEGGFRYEANDSPKQKGKLTAIPGIDRLHKLSANDVAKITATLTAEQIACADELVSYLSNECAEQGNAASMELFGIKKYNEEYYFPFKTASDQRYQRSDAGSTSTTNDARVKHASFTHSLRKGANTALVMGDFFDVIADHINLMATYSSFVVPIESMNRVLNTKINEEEDGSGNDVTIRSLVGRKHGDPAQKYIADLMKDLNGGPQTDNRGGISGLFRAFKRGAVMGSLSVALQQPTAIVRAFAYVNPKYFAHITMEGNKKTWERMMKYSGTTVIKDMGKFDVGTGRMANDWIANSDMQDYKLWQRAKFLMDTKGWSAVKDNFIETMTALPGVMDRITWSHIWKAIEAEQVELNPSMDRNSDEFLRTVGARFDDVINHTQVYDSILAKSQNMRSKNPLTQMSTAFMSEPTLNINMLYDAVRGDHSKGQRASIITSVITSNILAAAAAALIAAWNKDDDDRNAAEKYLTTFASRALDNLNPLTMIPYVADLWNLVNGYDIERTDLSVIKDAWNYGSTFMSKALDPEKENTWRDYENFFGTIANLFGIPAKNVSRDIRRARNFLATDKAPAPGSNLKYALVEELTPFGLYKASNAAYCQRLVAAVVDGDTQEAYDLWDYMTNGKKMSQGSLETNIRSELKRLVKAGEITPAQATDILRKYVPYKDDKNNVKYPQDWLNEKE